MLLNLYLCPECQIDTQQATVRRTTSIVALCCTGADAKLCKTTRVQHEALLIRDLVIWLRQGWVYTVWGFFCAIRWACQRTWGTQLRSQLKGLCFEMCTLALLCTSLIIFVLFLSFLCISRLSQSLLVKTVKCQRSFAETFTFSDCCKHSWTRWTSGLEDECNSCDQTTGRALHLVMGKLFFFSEMGSPETTWCMAPQCDLQRLKNCGAKDETIHGGLLKPFQNCGLWAFFGSTAKQSSRNLLLHAVTCC